MRNNTHNGYEYVDLGLPSGTLWAACNVGANAPEEYGGYYAWGEVSEKSVYDWDTYDFGTQGKLAEYNKTDGKTVLDLADDVVHATMGGYWHMPTEAQIKELIEETNREWTTVNGVNGLRLTSNTNGNSIFIPAAGNRWDSSVCRVGVDCSLWSSSINFAHVCGAACLHFRGGGIGISGYNSRYAGFSVRGVLNQK